jgi:hypothetical protein
VLYPCIVRTCVKRPNISGLLCSWRKILSGFVDGELAVTSRNELWRGELLNSFCHLLVTSLDFRSE